MNRIHLTAFALLAAGIASPPAALACSTCGCTLNSDWASQGFTGSSGFSLDLRHDFFDQNDLRSGTGRVDRSAIALPADREIQQKTVNRVSTLSLDYGGEADWGVTAQIPYAERFHTTIVDGDTGVSSVALVEPGRRSPARPLPGLFGTARLGRAARPQAADRPHRRRLQRRTAGGRSARSRPAAGHRLDRPAAGHLPLRNHRRELRLLRTGTAADSVDLERRVQARGGRQSHCWHPLCQRKPLRAAIADQRAHRAQGIGSERGRAELRATLVYLSPGVTAHCSATSSRPTTCLQAPIDQRVTGYQLEPKYSVSVGLHYSF